MKIELFSTGGVILESNLTVPFTETTFISQRSTITIIILLTCSPPPPSNKMKPGRLLGYIKEIGGVLGSAG